MLIMLQYFPLKTDIEKPLKQNIYFRLYNSTYIFYYTYMHTVFFLFYPQQYTR